MVYNIKLIIELVVHWVEEDFKRDLSKHCNTHSVINLYFPSDKVHVCLTMAGMMNVTVVLQI